MFTKSDIEKYFLAEKKGGAGFMSGGIISIITALTMVILRNTSFHQGISIPLTGIGLVLFIVGLVVYRRSDEDRKRKVYAFDMNPSELVREKDRMEKVMKQFVILKYIEILLFLAGTTLCVLFRNDDRNDFWRGLGLGLAVMAFVALVFDNYAERRGRKYLEGLNEFSKNTFV